MTEKDRQSLNSRQQDYFRNRKLNRLLPEETPYVKNHLNRILVAASPSRGDFLLEIGAGLGRFTLLLDSLGFNVMANDLSPDLLESLKKTSEGRITTLCCDIADIPQNTMKQYDLVLGFFVLHHLRDFEKVFKSLARVLKPGARVIFCEPNGLNFLYYLQIFFSPGMRFSQEPSISSMRQNVMTTALENSGFEDINISRYGYFPPFLKNRSWGDRLEQRLEANRFSPFPHAFMLISACRGGFE